MNESLVDETDHLQKTLIDIWQIYMKWYTFFFTANIAVLSWFVIRRSETISSIPPFAFSAFWVTLNLFATITSFVLMACSKNCASTISKIFDGQESLLPGRSESATMISRIAVWGAFFNSLSTLLMGAIWVWIAGR